MKTFMQAFICSLLIHILYFFSIYGWPYIKAKFNEPTLGVRYVADSHTDMMFVFIGSPVAFLGTSFLGIGIVCSFLIKWAKKYSKTRDIQ